MARKFSIITIIAALLLLLPATLRAQSPIDKPVKPVPSEQKGETTPTDAGKDKSAPRLQKKVDSGTASTTIAVKRLDLGYAVWSGGVSNGKPEGKGTMTFTQAHAVPTASGDPVAADSGDYIEGYAAAGKIEQGTLYGSDGSKKAAIIY